MTPWLDRMATVRSGVIEHPVSGEMPAAGGAAPDRAAICSEAQKVTACLRLFALHGHDARQHLPQSHHGLGRHPGMLLLLIPMPAPRWAPV
ncbi:hypothetical protein EYF80_055520 [Liparis tanakae]|uniref:Uncharacterized protein n=1 Tax=Liparis tanakae TaxID=230148 RepID=A0A4Z2EZC7_9TELE|nr:hypothetical protein EYF80_055520 [Liparis tanakae]